MHSQSKRIREFNRQITIRISNNLAIPKHQAQLTSPRTFEREILNWSLRNVGKRTPTNGYLLIDH